jgi:mannan endo-1,4-beta-mannosidase|tara:strand:- start:9917 stop:10105 length:189 start_codon:yes stop_codon:yes gene_type:complete
MDVNKLAQGVAQVQSANKVYFAAEYGWTPQSQQSGTKIEVFFDFIEKRNRADVAQPVVVGGK